MKKLLTFIIALAATLTLAACGSGTEQDIVADNLSSEESLATLSYLSAGFLDFSTPTTVQTGLVFLNDEDTTVIEEELDDVNLYFDRLKGMIDNGVESFGSVVEEVSDNELYEYKLTFTVNEEVYLIYYNLDDVTGEMTGIIIVGDQEYTFEVVDNMREYKYGEQEKNENAEQNANQNNDGGGAQNQDQEDEQNGNANQQNQDDDVDTEDEVDDEVDTEEEDEEDDANETKMMLVAHSGDDTIKIMYKTEVEDDETTTKFDMEQTIAGVTTQIRLKISMEEDEYKIDIEDGEDRYTFKQEVEDDAIVYKLTYQVDGVSGTVRITETVDENGETVYEYRIQEAGKQRNAERGRPESKGFDDDDDEPEDNEEDTEDDSNEA